MVTPTSVVIYTHGKKEAKDSKACLEDAFQSGLHGTPTVVEVGVKESLDGNN